MKKISILLIALVAILGFAWYKGNERTSRLNRNLTTVKLRELLFPTFDVNGIKKVRIKEEKSEATLVVQNDTWVVQERSGYPLDKEKLQTALLSLKYEKIKAGRRIGKDSWGKVNVNAPEAGYGVGTLVELYDDKDVLKHSFVLGGKVTSSGGSSSEQMNMFGGGSGNRFVRVLGEDTIWEIGEQLPDLVAKPDAWLSKPFIDVQKIKSVEVTFAKPEDSWKASRSDENADFILTDARPGEKLDPGKASLGALFSNATFNDVVTKEKAAAALKDAIKVKLVTFQGFTYDIQAAREAAQPGSGADKYYITVNVSATLPKERAAAKDEKPEDKKSKDEAFAAEKKALEEKLAAEQKMAGWVYEVSEYSVSSLLKKHSEIIAPPEKKDASAPGAAGTNALPDVKKMLPGIIPGSTPPVASPPPASVSTPPIQLPQPPKVELKPAPSPDASPVPGAKPLEPAKPADQPAKASDAPKPAEPAKEPAK